MAANSRSQSHGPGSGNISIPTCKISGCIKPRYIKHGYMHEYCSRRHAELACRMPFTSTKMSSGTSKEPSTSLQQYKPMKSSKETSARAAPMKGSHFTSPIKAITNVLTGNSKPIKFYNREDKYYEFTNFYRAQIKIDGKHWPTSEHYFQAQKFVGTPYVENIRKLFSAREAFQFSRDPKVSRWQRTDWDSVKDDVMYKALLCKFTQHEDLRDMLRSTGKRPLIEHTYNDSYWGDGGNGRGRNMLGKLLETVRDELTKVYGPLKEKDNAKDLGLHRSKRRNSFSFGSASKARSVGQGSSHPNSPPVDSGWDSGPRLSPSKRSSSFSNLTLIGSGNKDQYSNPALYEPSKYVQTRINGVNSTSKHLYSDIVSRSPSWQETGRQHDHDSHVSSKHYSSRTSTHVNTSKSNIQHETDPSRTFPKYDLSKHIHVTQSKPSYKHSDSTSCPVHSGSPNYSRLQNKAAASSQVNYSSISQIQTTLPSYPQGHQDRNDSSSMRNILQHDHH